MLIDAKELKALLLGAKNDIIATGKSVTYTQTYAVRKDRWTEGQNNTSCMICEKTCHQGCADTVHFRCYVFHKNHYSHDKSETESNAHDCIICGCPYTKHKFEDKVYWTEWKTKTVTDHDMLGKQNSAKEREAAFEKRMLELENENLCLQIDCMVAHMEV